MAFQQRHSYETVKAVIEYWNEERTAEWIRQRLHLPSRAAVLGIVHRAREREPSLITRPVLTARQAATQGAIACRHVRHVRRQKDRRRREATKPIFRTLALPQPQAEDVATITWEELEAHHCRFICGDAKDGVLSGAKMFCGKPIVPGTSWCTGHLGRVAAVPSRESRRKVPVASSSAEFAPHDLETSK